MADIFYERNKKYNFRNASSKPYFRITATINGKRRSIYGDGEKDALRKLEELKAASAQGFDLDKKNAKVGSVFSYWLYNVKRVGVKASSFARYDCTFRTHIQGYDLAKTQLSKLDSAALQRHINFLYEDKHLTISQIHETFKVWKMFLSWAYEEGYLIKNPAPKVSLPSKSKASKRIIEVFSESEREKISRYMAESHYQYEEIIRLAFATGMRQGELLALRWEDIYDGAIHVSQSTALVTHVDKDGNRDISREVWSPKTANAIRTIPLNSATKDMLNDLHLRQKKYMFAHRYKQSEYVFTSSTGEIVEARTLSRSYRRMLERAGVPYRKFHTIRHTFATEAIRHGVDVKDLQLLMGHSDISMTYVYVQSDDESKRSAIEKIGILM